MLQVLSDPIARLKPCLRCETSLKGHLDDKFCPTCGLSVWLSLNSGDSLEASNPNWLRKTAWVCFVMAGTQLMGIFALAGLIWAGRWGLLFVAGHSLLSAGAMWMLAINEKRHPDKLGGHRMWMRIAAGGHGALALGLIFAGGLGNFLMVAAYAAGALATWFYLRRLIRRSARPGLAKYASWILFLPALTAVLKIPFFGFCLLYSLSKLMMVVFPIVYFPASVVLLIVYGMVFKQSAVVAEALWLKETDPEKAHDGEKYKS